MQSKRTNKYSGITLLETSIYLAMFIVLFAAMMQFYFTIGRANQRASMQLRNERVAILLTQHTEELIRSADVFDEANSTYDTDLSTIRFTYGAGYWEYYVASGVIYVTDGTDTFALSPPSLDVSKFRADVSEDAGTSMYRIDIEVNYNDPDFPAVDKVLTLFYIID